MKKVALVTGASSGIGKATANQLINDGLTVYVAARRVEKMKDLEAMGAIAIKMDVTKEEDMVAGIEQIKRENGGVDVLVNNAGYAIYGSVEETTLEEARRQFDVNLFGLARITQLVLPYMREKKAGAIINLSSVGGKIYTPLGAWYHASKHAVEGWSDCLRLELKQFNIDVVIIEPGVIATEFTDVMTEPMIKRSGSGPYKWLTGQLALNTAKMYEGGKASPPEVIAKEIAKAVKARKPKIRYRAGYMAKTGIFMRWLLSDKLFDKGIMSMAK